MKISDLPPSGLRFTVKLGTTRFPMVRYPIDVPAPENAVGWINNSVRKDGAYYRDGAWRMKSGKLFSWEPTHWTVMLDA